MKRFRNLLVYVSLRGADASLVRFAAKISHLANSERVHFFHADLPPEIPEELREKYPWLLEPIDEAAQRKLQQLVDEHFDGPASTEVSQEVAQGSPVYETLKRSQKLDTDLILIDRVAHDESLAIKLARKSTSSLLILPGEVEPSFANILVPIDFSSYSSDALDVAFAFAQAQNTPKITVHHAFSLPHGHHKATVSEDAFAASVHEYTKKQMREYLGQQDTRGIESELHLVQNPLVVESIREATETLGSDLVLVGSRGRNAVASLLLGNNAEAVIQSTDVPLIIVKKKGSGQTLLKALLEAYA